MTAIILAAGMGKRLGRLTQDRPKCLVEVNSRSLIERALDNLLDFNLDKVVIVVGYKAEVLRNRLGNNYKGLRIEYIENPAYDRTNNIYSLWLAREHLCSDDCIVLESDIIFDNGIIKKIFESKDECVAAVDRYKFWMDGTVAILDDDGRILAFLNKEEASLDFDGELYKTVNIYKFGRRFSERVYLPFLEAYIKAFGENAYYEQVLRVISKATTIKAVKVEGARWYEIDNIEDLHEAELLFTEGQVKLTKTEGTFGGYWRAETMLDFCYVVNPFFPPDAMVQEIRKKLGALIKNYPSTIRVQNILAGKLFGCDPDLIIVGNGTSELIKALAFSLTGTVGIICPTFNEYPEAFGNERTIKLYREQQSGTFKKKISEVIELVSRTDNLVLINPDNPTGDFLSYEEALEVVQYAARNGKKIIWDESFIDFAETSARYSFLSDDFLLKHDNVIVIKSIGKSYGVPGIRVGIAATSDRRFLEEIKRRLPIWNVNSVAEFTMQIMHKYASHYTQSCNALAEERKRLAGQLRSLQGITVFESQANYLLCRLGHHDSRRVSAMLLGKGILVKDLSNKEGLDGNYLRIAVKTREENDYLCMCLRQILDDGE